jgi:hypothetical protein
MIRKKPLYKPEPNTLGTKSGGSLSFSDASRSNFVQPARKKIGRQPFVGGILFICIAMITLVLVGHFLITSPLEQSVLNEQARCLAKELDGLVSARSAAVRVAADNLDIDNLSAAGGLDRLLSSLRTLFPDLSNIELLNSRGQSLAMMGNLNLFLAGSSKSAQILVNSAAPEAELVFRDDPANQSFLIIMRHGDPDSGYWFSRTRFSRTGVDSILASARSGRSPVLVMHEIPKNPNEESESNATNSGPSAARSNERAHTRWWNPGKSTDVQLSVPGWTLHLENIPGWMDYCPHVLIPSLILLLVALCYIRREDSKQPKDFQYSGSNDAPRSVDPEWDDLPEFPYDVRHGSDRSRRSSIDEIAYSPGDPQIITTDSVKNFRDVDGVVEDGHSLGGLLPEFFYEPDADIVAPDDRANDNVAGAESPPVDQFPETLEVTWFEPRTNESEVDSDEPQYVADSKVLGA